jgi:flagellar biosynthesis chaperone FliJ
VLLQGSGQITQVWNAAQQVKQLETEVAQLRQALQAAQEAVINSQQACNSTKTSVSTQAALSSILTATNHNTVWRNTAAELYQCW